ncbi:MAG: hypothetical protein LC789_11635 [Actinobacteria bacterium]|nr:hypothetical protein [Actinomycetota bacterium]
MRRHGFIGLDWQDQQCARPVTPRALHEAGLRPLDVFGMADRGRIETGCALLVDKHVTFGQVSDANRLGGNGDLHYLDRAALTRRLDRADRAAPVAGDDSSSCVPEGLGCSPASRGLCVGTTGAGAGPSAGDRRQASGVRQGTRAALVVSANAAVPPAPSAQVA